MRVVSLRRLEVDESQATSDDTSLSWPEERDERSGEGRAVTSHQLGALAGCRKAES